MRVFVQWAVGIVGLGGDHRGEDRVADRRGEDRRGEDHQMEDRQMGDRRVDLNPVADQLGLGLSPMSRLSQRVVLKSDGD